MQNYIIPSVTEQEGRGERSYDLYSRFLLDRVIWVPEINQDTANAISAQLLFLQMNDNGNKEPIKMYINSPGGSILDGDGILDTMDYVKGKGFRIETMVIGSACSFGSLILANGTKGFRKVLPRSRVMIHQPLGGAQGQASDILIKAELIVKMKHEITELLAEKTGQTYEVIEKACDRDSWYRGQEAVDFGLADVVVKTI